MRYFAMAANNTFNSRFFNQLEVHDQIVTKSSHDKTKIKKEYQFYHLLPTDLKHWMVKPFNYHETIDQASYQMPLITTSDLAHKWIEDSLSPQEFSLVLDIFFRFINSRPTKTLTPSEHSRITHNLYLAKTANRINTLKISPIYPTLSQEIPLYTKYPNLDAIYHDYEKLYRTITTSTKPNPTTAISHGDLCFSNTFFLPDTNQLLFIDPRGALTSDELYLDQYYDIAKLSHSVCGHYDYFNAHKFRLSPSTGLEFITPSNQFPHQQLFKTALADNQYDYKLTRLYEASLFLSMLPLHIDYPQKVLGFILNAINIMEEIKHEL